MAYTIKTIPQFDKEFKNLSKKYLSLKDDLKELLEELKINPKAGSHLGENVYKTRMAVTSKGRGKSGGARIITFLKIENECIYLLSIYDKAERNTITDNEIKQLLKNISENNNN